MSNDAAQWTKGTIDNLDGTRHAHSEHAAKSYCGNSPCMATSYQILLGWGLMFKTRIRSPALFL
jgi:hypothetical protein